MDAFDVHRRLIDDYRSFTEAFVDIRDERIQHMVQHQSALGVQWPYPWLSLNPSFATGGTIAELVADQILHPECERVFRVKKQPTDPGTHGITLHQHRDAVDGFVCQLRIDDAGEVDR